MQIYGIGTDIVKCARIANLWQQGGENFARRILSAVELGIFTADIHKNTEKAVAFLAKRFAAKEAVAKALGTGFRDEVFLTHIGIVADSYGKPEVELYGATKEYVAGLGNLQITLSIADEEDYVVAFVVITI